MHRKVGKPFWVELEALEAPKITPAELGKVLTKHEPIAFINHVKSLFVGVCNTAEQIIQGILKNKANGDVNMLNTVSGIKNIITNDIVNSMTDCVKAS